MTNPAVAPSNSERQHDPHCPKSFPARVFANAETGDPWLMGPTKLLCQCDHLAVARKSGRGGLDLHMAYVRSQLSEDDAAAAAASEDAERLRDLQRLLDIAAKVIRREDVWDWLRAPNAALGGAVPLDLIAAGKQERVVDLLAAPAEGVTG
jgi:hypothetical protein